MDFCVNCQKTHKEKYPGHKIQEYKPEKFDPLINGINRNIVSRYRNKNRANRQIY